MLKLEIRNGNYWGLFIYMMRGLIHTTVRLAAGVTRCGQWAYASSAVLILAVAGSSPGLCGLVIYRDAIEWGSLAEHLQLTVFTLQPPRQTIGDGHVRASTILSMISGVKLVLVAQTCTRLNYNDESLSQAYSQFFRTFLSP
jgi:hypothetical protein